MNRLNEYIEVAKDKKASKIEFEKVMSENVSGKLKEDVEKLLKLYIGKKPNDVEIISDPNVSGTYAIEADSNHFLLTGYNKSKTFRDLFGDLEECEFSSWPPKSKDF